MIRIPIAAKLTLSFLLIILFTSIAFIIIGIFLIRDRILSDAREKLRYDLDTAREIYLENLNHVKNTVKSASTMPCVNEGLIQENFDYTYDCLSIAKIGEGLDFLTLTDKAGYVVLRTDNPNFKGDDVSNEELIQEVIENKDSISGTMIVSNRFLRKESPVLADELSDSVTSDKEAMVMIAAYPIFDTEKSLIGVIYGVLLINNNMDIVDEIRRTVFHNLRYKGKDIGVASIFQDNYSISTYIKQLDGTRAVGTTVDEAIYDQVVGERRRWIGRDNVGNNWYISAYEPIIDVNYEPVGILHLGVLEQRYLDIIDETVYAFLGITLIIIIVALGFSYIISRNISIPIKNLVSASQDIASGNFNARVKPKSRTNDELDDLSMAFNSMALALKERDEKLKEFTKTKIMETEKLAMIGQLSANVAHELNNPMQGVFTFAHLLLEKMHKDDPNRKYAEKIVNQTDRCKSIIRGLLDFARQQKPDITLSDVNLVLNDCVALVENQAIFHNINIEKVFDANLPNIYIDPSQIERVFLNIIINAAEAMETIGHLRLETKFDPSDNFIEIHFSDTGPGIKPEDLDKIFDPFFTTKDVGHGTGLGLAISYGIVKEHGGDIQVNSELGKGTKFIVRLPVDLEF